MNSTEFYIAAGEAICEWGKTHSEGCVLDQMEGCVVCVPMNTRTPCQNEKLVVSKYEVEHGMASARWDQIGTELHNLFCKELACQAHQKP